MSSRRSGRPPRTVLLAGLVGSVLLHAGVLGCMVGFASSFQAANTDVQDNKWRTLFQALSGLTTPDTFLNDYDVVSEVAFVAESEVLPRPALSAAAGDQFRQVLEETAPRLAAGADRRAPSPDTGVGAGRTPDDSQAFRRDNENLIAQLTDGADHDAASRIRTASHSASPQAIRQEPLTGSGDAPRTGRRPHPASVETAQRDFGEDAESDAASSKTPELAQPGTVTLPGVGPLEAEEGERRFDADPRGVATEAVDTRAASDERHPAPLAFSSPAAPGPEHEDGHRGPGMKPGAVARPARGQATAEYGAPVAAAPGQEVAVNARDPRRARFEREIRNRVRRVLGFPRRLALMLEQGETIVRFVVDREGQVSGGVTVVKSAGFEDFDVEAVSAVTRAAPFPRMPMTLLVNMRVPFENPVIR